jgi:hypothetical protein
MPYNTPRNQSRTHDVCKALGFEKEVTQRVFQYLVIDIV